MNQWEKSKLRVKVFGKTETTYFDLTLILQIILLFIQKCHALKYSFNSVSPGCFGWRTPYSVIRLKGNYISRLLSRRNRWVDITHGAGLSSRKSVFQLGRPRLPVACAGHCLGEEKLEEKRLRTSDAGGFLLHIPVRRIYRHQYSDIAEYGGRSEKPRHFLVFTRFIFVCDKLLYLLELT